MSDYTDFLRREVFKVEEYAQFELLFSSLASMTYEHAEHVAILERSYIYNGQSIFAGLVDAPQISIIDYQNLHAGERSGYQAGWLEESGFNYPKSTLSVHDNGEQAVADFATLDCSTLLIPNVLHHCRDFPAMLSLFVEKMPQLKRLYVYDSYLREHHQAPDDYCRYTPSALEDACKTIGFEMTSQTESGNAFDAILYFISQSEKILDRPELAKTRALLMDEVVPHLRPLRHLEIYRDLGRPYASITTSYAMIFTRR